jgi:hypothetical protein
LIELIIEILKVAFESEGNVKSALEKGGIKIILKVLTNHFESYKEGEQDIFLQNLLDTVFKLISKLNCFSNSK